ncbi:CXADR-like membrane protein [Hyla sarda]|uniref:CXADR-like membrane protein n=1 Tax=Hyla sarda TaxID=327740 RepID=UPI0024C35AB3|nr:CXADR-like membrane protein [Hyla sarda]
MQTLLRSFLGLCCVVGAFAQTVIEKISEDNATLPCQHRLSTVGKHLDIEWLIDVSDVKQKVILSYSGGEVYKEEGRYSFISDYLAGDAAMFIRSLVPSDARKYTCKVKNVGQFIWSTIFLKILVKPSEPHCWIEGEQVVGRNVTLHCKSSAGSLPMKYYWKRRKNQEYSGNLPTRPEFPHKLFLQNVSTEDNVSYRCIVWNTAGERMCDVHLNVKVPTNVAFLAVVTCGSVGGVLFLFLICWYLFRKKELKKRKEDEFLNEIREDAEAPKARLMKPGSSSSGSRSSRSGSSSTRSTTNSASRSQRTLSTQEAPHRDSRHHCLEQI